MTTTQWAGVLVALADIGWQQVEEVEPNDWWALRQTKLRRENQTICLTLLADPQSSQAKPNAWAMALDHLASRTRLEAGEIALVVLKGWRKDLNCVIEILK